MCEIFANERCQVKRLVQLNIQGEHLLSNELFAV